MKKLAKKSEKTEKTQKEKSRWEMETNYRKIRGGSSSSSILLSSTATTLLFFSPINLNYLSAAEHTCKFLVLTFTSWRNTYSPTHADFD